MGLGYDDYGYKPIFGHNSYGYQKPNYGGYDNYGYKTTYGHDSYGYQMPTYGGYDDYGYKTTYGHDFYGYQKPTQELAIQIKEEARKFSGGTNIDGKGKIAKKLRWNLPFFP